MLNHLRRTPWFAALALVCVLVATAEGFAAAGATHVLTDVTQPYAHSHGVDGPRGSVEVAKAAQMSTPQRRCGRGSRPETGRQGRVPLADYASGRAAKGYTCNAAVVGHTGISGGYQVHRYVDTAGRECAVYDGDLVFPTNATKGEASGTFVLDMTNPAKPVRTAVLDSPAMLSPHESLRLDAKRGLLMAAAGAPTTQVGFFDVWDLSSDCRHPVLRSSSPIALLGHEGGLSPDGKTYWATTTFARGITAIDVTDPDLPRVLGRYDYHVHGLSISDDGNRAYLADVDDGPTTNFVSATTQGGGGLRILDISQVQQRVPVPQVREVGHVTWPEVTIPQNTIPVTIKGRPYVIEFDEFDTNVYSYTPDENVGGIRIIDVSDERRPTVVSRIRLKVWNRKARADQGDDPGAATLGQGYAAHYCSVPRRREPGMLACGTIASGLRVFDIRKPRAPREVAYANHPHVGGPDSEPAGAYAMSAPAFVPQRKEIWYSDVNTGFWVVRLTNGAWIRPGRRR
jgi:hypothetical protein